MMSRALRLLPLLVFVLVVSACAGPRPEVVSHELGDPASPGDPYILTVVVKNAGRGEGQVEVVGQLLSESSEEVLAQSAELVDLDAHEVVHVSIELRPNQPGPYRTVATVKYPP